MVFNGVTNQFYTTKLPFRDDCLSHETYPEPVELSRWATHRRCSNSSPRPRKTIEGPLTLVLERDLVAAIHCPRCDRRTEILRPRTKVGMSEAICPNCNEPGRPEILNAIEQDSPLQASRWRWLESPRTIS